MTKKETIVEVGTRKFMLKGYEPIKDPVVSGLATHSLMGIVDAVINRLEPEVNYEVGDVIIHVISPTAARLITQSSGPFLQRNVLVEAEAYTTDFKYGHFYDTEQFIIALTSQFIQTDVRDKLLGLVASMTQETSRTLVDNGASQEMVVRDKVAMKAKVSVQNPFILQPFRTFSEIDQPESPFVFRVKSFDDEIGCALFEADGSRWRIDATDKIKAFFNKEIPDVVVIA